MPKALLTFTDDYGDPVQPGDVAAPERARVLQRLGLVDDSPPGRRRWPATVPDVPEPPAPSVAITRSVSGQGAALMLGRVRE
jgi:hypothetical protein